LEKELGVKAEIEVGPPGKFIIDVDGEVVAEKGMLGFPSEEEIVAAVRKRMRPG
jgi:predicted Rdx family selenoprotein